jgi:stage II sporulation protein AA (anti-sigma F factor antagonist)
MNINLLEKNRCLIVQLSGEIDHHSLEDTRDNIDKAFQRSNAKNMIFDFKDVGFMDSSGIGLVIGRYRLIEQKGGKVAAANISGDLKRIFEISGLKKIIPCFDNIDEAVTMIV